ncbi:unnamed protein product [Notodromas monacha]|uniref:Uncharacterized protein n=1 Tax=Notodromas monacha TaxID=399045 RepID=A0A7R9GEH0_9CRUS|nr:unnamed protein product [Notodromas monacha]CAG0918050.1 unnamed protein product [Notodromas monacha]
MSTTLSWLSFTGSTLIRVSAFLPFLAINLEIRFVCALEMFAKIYNLVPQISPEQMSLHGEPGTEAEIVKFAEGFGVQFDMFAKIEVNGGNAHPLWKWLKEQKGGFLGRTLKRKFKSCCRVKKLTVAALILSSLCHWEEVV